MSNVIQFPKQTIYVTDSKPQESREEFGDDYDMYESWCAQMIGKCKRTGNIVQLVPVTATEYFNIKLGE